MVPIICSRQVGLSLTYNPKMINKIGSCYSVSDKQKEDA